MNLKHSDLEDASIFAMNLRRRRMLVRGLSQVRMSRNLGVSRVTYARYENGKRRPPAWFVVKAADYFGITVEEMYQKG